MNKFTGTSYLGLQTDAEYVAIVMDGLRRYGISNPVSRLSDEDFSVLQQAESEIAHFFQCEDACLFSSGYLAGIAIRRWAKLTCERQDFVVLESQDRHPCLAGDISASSRALCDEKALELLQQRKDDCAIKGWCALCNSVDSFHGCPSTALTSPVMQKAAIQVIDVSHSAFIWMQVPGQSCHPLGSDGEVVYVGSLNKAAAFPAGFVTGRQDTIETLRSRPEYTASSAVSRAHAYAFCESSALRQRKLNSLQHLLKGAEQELGIDRGRWSFPVYHVGTNCEQLYRELIQADLLLSYLPYPIPDSDMHLRLVINANHGENIIQNAIHELRDRSICPANGPSRDHWYLTR